MAFVVCPKHDRRFETMQDHRWPGAVNKAKRDGEPDTLAHPVNGHPECPLCKQEAETGIDANNGSKMERKTSSSSGRIVA